MKLETFFENFELLTDAPNAIAKLHKLILQLAVRGKLVTQKHDDEPAIFFLENIETEKKKLIKSNKIKKIETLPVNKDISFLLNLPKKWELIRLGDLVEKLGAGSTPLGGKNIYVDDGIKFLRSQNVWNDGLKLDEVAYITSEIHQKMSGTVVKAGDILLNITGASIGRCAVVPDNFDEGNVSQHVSIIRLINKDLRHYLHLCVISSLIQNQIMEVQVGISREGLSMNSLKDFLIPVPPLAEQKRIVEKCDRLLSTCDEIEKRQQQRQESILRMNESAIAQLLSSQNPDEFRQHWQRICNNFDLLYSVPETIPKLRQVILQLAVQGKLVRQDPNDEPARELLNKIKSDQSKSFPPISSEEIPFDLPNGWIFARLGNLIEPSRDITYGIIKLGLEPTEDGVKTLRCSDILYRRINNSNIRSVARDLSEQYSRTIIQGGELLMNIRGTLGGCAIATEAYKGCNIAREVAMIPISRHISNLYILDVISSPFIQIKTMQNLRGIAYKGLNLNLLRMFVIPLPPLAEQKRIVEKCDRLMSLCDTLEAKLKQGRDSSEKLMEVAAKHVLTA